MKFTKKELYEIEKMFDISAGHLTDAHARMMNIVSPLAKNGNKVEKHLHKLFDEHVEAWDVYRTISAKASKMRENV